MGGTPETAPQPDDDADPGGGALLVDRGDVASSPVSVASPGRGPRLDGVDVARAVALVGMLLAHYARPVRPDDAGWLRALDAAADGRAAPLFCVLLGLGAGLLAARPTADRVLVRRGVLLGALGLAIWPVVDRVLLILPHYGLLLTLVPALRRLPDRWLVGAAAGAFLLPSVVAGAVDGHGLRTTPQPDRYLDLLDPVALVTHVVWNGGYPVAGWMGFVLAGLWLARRPLGDARVQRRLVAAGAAMAALQPLAALVFDALGGSPEDPDAAGWAAFFDGAAHSNRTGWYVLATGTAMAVIGVCLLVAPAARAVLRPVRRLGQQALSAYLLHLCIGAAFVWDWRDEAHPALGAQLAVVLGVAAGLAVLADLWGRRWRRGPVESVLRALAP